jgi:predicted anti-sigma-YlaC factor YlaD
VPKQGNANGCTCQDVARQATEFLENRLPAAASVAIWRHLEGCADCRTYLEQMAVVRDSLHKLPEAKMPDAMRDKLLKRLRRVTRGKD